MLKMILALLILVSANPGDSKTEIKNYITNVHQLENSDFIYNEYQEDIFSDGKIKKSITEYKLPDGKLLSKRIMEFKNDLTKPSFTYEDFRSGFIEGAELITTGVVKVFTRESSDDNMEESILRVEEPFVIGGGFIFLCRQNWDRLLNGETIDFNFVTPSQLDYYEFRVMKEEMVTISGREGLKIRLEPTSFIIRAFVDPIFITFAMDDQHVIYYTGISSVKNDEGKSYNIEIDYTQKENM